MVELDELRSLGDKELAIFNAEVGRQRKSTGVAYVLWIFLGGIGAHQFYMNRWQRGLLYLLLAGFSWFFMFGGLVAGMAGETEAQTQDAASVMVLGSLSFFVLALFLLWDLFTLPRQIRKRDERIRQELFDRLKTA